MSNSADDMHLDDLTEAYESASEFVGLPPDGQYPIVVIGTRLKYVGTDDRKLEIGCEVTSGDDAGMQFPWDLSLKQNTMWTVKRAFSSLGHRMDDIRDLPHLRHELHGVKAILKVETTEGKLKEDGTRGNPFRNAKVLKIITDDATAPSKENLGRQAAPPAAARQRQPGDDDGYVPPPTDKDAPWG